MDCLLYYVYATFFFFFFFFAFHFWRKNCAPPLFVAELRHWPWTDYPQYKSGFHISVCFSPKLKNAADWSAIAEASEFWKQKQTSLHGKFYNHVHILPYICIFNELCTFLTNSDSIFCIAMIFVQNFLWLLLDQNINFTGRGRN